MPSLFHTSGGLKQAAANRGLNVPFSTCSRIVGLSGASEWEKKTKDLKTEDDLGPLKTSLWRSSGPHLSKILHGPTSRLRKHWKSDAMSRLQAAFCITCIVIRVTSAAEAAVAAAVGAAKVAYRDLQKHHDLQLHTKGTIIHIQRVSRLKTICLYGRRPRRRTGGFHGGRG